MSLALVLLMIPVVVRTTEEMLKLVPDELREASYALGVPKWKTIARIVLPTALPGIITGILLALARVMGETAPVLILVGYAQVDQLRPVRRQHGIAALVDLHRTRSTRSRPDALRVWGAALTLIVLDRAAHTSRAAFVARFLCPQSSSTI